MKLSFDNFNDLHPDNYLILYDLTKLKIKSVNECSDKLDTKSYVLMIVYISILGAISCFFVGNLDKIASPYVLGVYSIPAVGCIFSISLVLYSIMTKKYYGDGFKPSDILNSNTDKYYLSDKK